MANDEISIDGESRFGPVTLTMSRRDVESPVTDLVTSIIAARVDIARTEFSEVGNDLETPRKAGEQVAAVIVSEFFQALPKALGLAVDAAFEASMFSAFVQKTYSLGGRVSLSCGLNRAEYVDIKVRLFGQRIRALLKAPKKSARWSRFRSVPDANWLALRSMVDGPLTAVYRNARREFLRKSDAPVEQRVERVLRAGLDERSLETALLLLPRILRSEDERSQPHRLACLHGAIALGFADYTDDSKHLERELKTRTKKAIR